MEGRPVSVVESITLPAQPTTGTTRYIPLGGDGYISPFAASAVRGFALTGDASSGVIETRVNLDPRFVALVSFVTIQIAQGTAADADFRIDVFNDEAAIVNSGAIESIASLINSNEVSRTYRPPANLMPGGDKTQFVRAQVLNVNGDVFQMDLFVYLFNIRVREVTPIAPLLWAQGGSS